ncbi:sigma 54-interacting transcriptional regulator [Paracoccaceae bacterium GXU_MW_L88]
MDGTILIADDDRTIRTVLTQALTRAGCKVRATATITTLLRWAEEGEGDVVITDVLMPDGDMLERLGDLKTARPDLPIIVMSAQNTIVTAIRAEEQGAFEYLPKPFDLRALIGHVKRALDRRPAKTVPNTQPDNLPLIGRSDAMQKLYKLMARTMQLDMPVLISGESGTGKGLVAKTLHDYGDSGSAPFITVNLAAADAESLGEALFGPNGALERARGGTLFLDEIGDLPMALQGRLLAILTAENSPRILASTQRNLRKKVAEKVFREDVFHRLNVMPIDLPPLRERLDDIPDLVRHFLQSAPSESGGFSNEALDRLRAYSWPGNLRELQNLVVRLSALAGGNEVTEAMVAEALDDAPAMPSRDNGSLRGAIEAHLRRYFALHGEALPPAGLYHRILSELEQPLIELSLDATGGNQIRTAELLGLNRNTLRKKITNYDIAVTRSRKMM